MDAIRLLTDDHREVKELFHEYESAGERAHKRKQRIVEQVFHALQAHTRVEEEIFYPAVQAKADHEGEELVAESRQEHHVVDVLMSEMQTLEPDNPEYEAKFKVLMENVEHHAKEEKKEMFPLAKQRLRDELKELGERMQQRKDELMVVAR